jgi:hypothetical protein
VTGEHKDPVDPVAERDQQIGAIAQQFPDWEAWHATAPA